MPFPGNLTILAVCLALPCLAVSARAETYDARVNGTQILTPPPGPAPAINGPEVYGVRPGSPVIYRIPTTGRRPIRFNAKDLPDTLRIDQAKGFVTGHAPASEVRDADGRILPNKNFPDMPALTGFIHALGLKAGIYSSPGPRTCQQFEGSYGHEEIDVKTYADWGFDLLTTPFLPVSKPIFSPLRVGVALAQGLTTCDHPARWQVGGVMQIAQSGVK
jgi:hypothetical protein